LDIYDAGFWMLDAGKEKIARCFISQLVEIMIIIFNIIYLNKKQIKYSGYPVSSIQYLVAL
jgi:hypothetical protein